MAHYPENDPRLLDPNGRIAYLQTMAFDADQLARGFEKFAQQNLANSELHAYFRRLGTICREFCTQVTHITSAVSPKILDALERVRLPPKMPAPFQSIKTTKQK